MEVEHRFEFYFQPHHETSLGQYISQHVFIRPYSRSLECTFGGIRVLLLYLGVSPLSPTILAGRCVHRVVCLHAIITPNARLFVLKRSSLRYMYIVGRRPAARFSGSCSASPASPHPSDTAEMHCRSLCSSREKIYRLGGVFY